MGGKGDIIALNRRRCILAFSLCVIVIAGVFTGVVTKLVAAPSQLEPDGGIQAFRYFTVLSGVLMAFSAALCIPFEIDGLRNHNYHLPRWVVVMLYCGVCSVAVTLIFSVCVIAPAIGIESALFSNGFLYLHMICPVASILLFLFVNDDHRIAFKYSFMVLIPPAAYALMYWIQVFVIGEANGGWGDHYKTNELVPYPVTFIVLMLVVFAAANAIRAAHNKRHKRKKALVENYYLTSPDFACGTVEEAIALLARREKPLDRGGEVIVPRRLILMLKKRYKSEKNVEELCKCYLTAFFKEG